MENSAQVESHVALAERLRQAVRAAGGNQAVAERSGVPVATVNNYVRGRNGMKIEPLTKLAAACGVSLEWLVSGDAPPLPGFMPGAVAARSGLAEAWAGPLVAGSGGIDVASLAKAIELVRAIAGNASLDDEPTLLARRIASAYAVLVQPHATPD